MEGERMERVPHWIEGKRWEGSVARSGPVFDPATGEQRARVDYADAATVDAAVDAARAAFPGWRDTSLARRSTVLFAFRQLLHAQREPLARLITAEHGKVLDDALGEVQRGLEVADFACGIPHLLKGGYSENVSTQIDAYSFRQPLGVCAVISPFNFPVMVPMWFVPLAIACGNAVVLKPSEKDPSASVRVAELWAEAGLPAGVLSVVHGDREAVDRLLEHPQVASVSFVGSTPVARAIYQRGTGHGKRVQALGGAKNHMVVLPDADLDLAADAAVSAGYGSAGERCMAISVVVAVDPIGDQLVAKIADRARRLRLGSGLRPGVEMGPLVTADHRDRVAAYVEAGAAAGARLVVDGRGWPVEGEPGGFWLGPCLLDLVTPEMTVYRDEIFGPVLSVVRVDSYPQALELVNRNPWGNGTAIFTADGGAARRFQNEVEVGLIGINVPIPVPTAYYSFGGWKASLFGDTHAHGSDGVHFFTRGKAVTARWPGRSQGGVSMGFPVSR
ncbi:MAG TPA: CoA-acylating methylmalonate-semialdehyde dehydrogenase [Verrucomicrobiae bacterium]|nr:CoA-acylating methylmalonate-semialdehyde dehydrogenase [Verrucomicrobiae bacterium]